jgi:putative ABC transport system permease protein
MILDYVKIAFINLKGKKLRSWLTLLGILIGITAVVALIGLGNGLKTAITSQFGISSTEVLAVQAGGVSGAGPPGVGVVNPLTKEDVNAIEKLNNVEYAIPRNIEYLRAEYNKKIEIFYAISMPDGEERKLAEEVMDIEAEYGRLLKDGDFDKVVLGSGFASDDNMFKKKILPGDRILLDDSQFEVIGILKKKGSFMFDNAAFINEQKLRDITGNKEDVSIIAVKVVNKEDLESVKGDIEKLLRKRRDVKEGHEDFTVQTPDAILSSVESILTGVQVFIVIIASISIVVGALGIVNTMLTAVLERRPQIGIMKAIGAKNKDIFYIFFFESGFLGLVGGAIGIILGTLISYIGTIGINSFVGSQAEPNINFMLISLALLGSFLIGAASGIVPALRAARQHPVDALKG